MLYIIYGLFAVGIFFITFSAIGSINSTVQLRQRLPVDVSQIKKNKFETYLAPLIVASGVILEKIKLKEKIHQKLIASHVRLTPEKFFSIQLMVMALLTYLTSTFFSAKPPVLIFAMVLGYSIPDLWLSKKIRQRKQTISRILPETIDLLGLCMEAGLDFTTALEWIVKKTKPTPMIEELGAVLEEIKWGKSRSQALKDMSKRFNIQELHSFVQSLIQAERMGTPVVEVFKIISDDTRIMRFQKGERYALKAPIKMLIPLIFCILPVIGIVIGGPIIIQFMTGNLFKGF